MEWPTNNEPTGESTMKPATYRIRLRVHIAKKFNTTDVMRTVSIDGREVSIRSQMRGQPLKDTHWIVLSAGGFINEQEASEFGEGLRALTLFAGLCCRLGIDVGSDRARGYMNEDYARSQSLIAPDERLAPNVHGLSILIDDEKNKIPIVEIKAEVMSEPNLFSQTLVELDKASLPRLERSAAGVRVLNLAVSSSEPHSRIVLALSAVEELGQGETWNQKQLDMIAGLAKQIDSSDCCEPGEDRKEIADAVRRMYRIGLRQGVIRVLKRLGLTLLQKEWDRIYGLRSGIFHGTAHLTNDQVSQLAHDAIAISERIILTAAAREGATLPFVCDTNFPASRNM